MNPELWKLIAAIGGLLVSAVTGPIIWAIRAEAGKWRAELKLEHTQIKADIAAAEARLEKQMGEMEKWLNERIDTRLVHR